MVVGKLLVEFGGRVVTKIVAKLDQQDVRLVQTRFLAVLIDEQSCFFVHIVIGDGLWWYFPWTVNRRLPLRTNKETVSLISIQELMNRFKPQTSEVKLATNFWVWTASVWHIVAIKRHHVAEHIRLAVVI